MKQTFSPTENAQNEPLELYSDYQRNLFVKMRASYEGIIGNVLQSSLSFKDKNQLLLEAKQSIERAILLDLK
jgi:hypothetical protein